MAMVSGWNFTQVHSCHCPKSFLLDCFLRNYTLSFGKKSQYKSLPLGQVTDIILLNIRLKIDY